MTANRDGSAPKIQNNGSGAKVVKGIIPSAGTLYVETTAVMARHNRLSEKAGMTKTAETGDDKKVKKATEESENLVFKPCAVARGET